jgi:hypothetical protein
MRSNGPVSARSSKDATWSRARRIRDVAPGSRNHRNADVDGGQAQRPVGQLPGELARAAANFQHRSARADRGIRENGVDDLGGIALAGGVIQLSDAVEKAPPLLPSPALHLRLTGHDHNLPSTAAHSQQTPASNPQPPPPPPSSSSLFCRCGYWRSAEPRLAKACSQSAHSTMNRPKHAGQRRSDVDRPP